MAEEPNIGKLRIDVTFPNGETAGVAFEKTPETKEAFQAGMMVLEMEIARRWFMGNSERLFWESPLSWMIEQAPVGSRERDILLNMKAEKEASRG